MAARRKPVTTKRPDRPPFILGEWLVAAYTSLTREQQDAIDALLETYTDANAAAARKAVR